MGSIRSMWRPPPPWRSGNLGLRIKTILVLISIWIIFGCIKNYLRINIPKEGIPCGCWMCREEEYGRKEYKRETWCIIKE